jgi:hypothetical protein
MKRRVTRIEIETQDDRVKLVAEGIPAVLILPLVLARGLPNSPTRGKRRGRDFAEPGMLDQHWKWLINLVVSLAWWLGRSS